MELHNSLQYSRAISPTRVTDTTAQVSQIIDMQGYSALEFVILLGTLADADATFTALVEHGNDSGLSDAAAVGDEDLLGVEAAATGAGFTFADDDTIERIGYKGVKRYVRLTITPAANTGNADIGVVAVRQGRINPQAVNV